MSRTWDEYIDGGETLAKSFVTLKAKTTRDSLIIASQGQFILQKKTKAVRRDFTLLTSAFDANGSVPLSAMLGGGWGDGGGGLTSEALSGSGLVWNLSELPQGDVAVFDGAKLSAGVDYTIAGKVVTFAIAPTNPSAVYTAFTGFTSMRYYDIGTLVRAYYYPAGSLIAQPVHIVGYGQIMDMRRKLSYTNNGIWPAGPISATPEIAITIYAGRLYCYPATGLNGTLVITQIPKLTKYSIVQGALTTGYWANYEANIDLAITTNGPEPEFDFAEDGLEAYIAAQLLKKMPAALMTYNEEYMEWMALWKSTFEDVIQGDVPYNIGQGPRGYSGPAQHR